MSMNRSLTSLAALTVAAGTVTVAAGCGGSSGSAGAAASATATKSPFAAEVTLESALPELMPGYGPLVYKEPVPILKANGVKGDAACQGFANAVYLDRDTYHPIGEVVAQYTQTPSSKTPDGAAGITLARFASAGDAARVVSDVKSNAPGCKSGFSHNNENITVAAADPPAGTPGDSATAVVETSSGSATPGGKAWVLVVQKGTAVVQIAVHETGQNLDEPAIAKTIATTLVAH